MNIRTMNISDYDSVYALWLSCKNMGFNDVDDSRDGIKRFLERNPSTCFVAEKDGGIVGVIISGNDGRRGYIYHMSVAEKYRRCGIGTMLVNTCLSALKNEGISKVALLVFRYNESGNAFWKKNGFTLRDDIVYRNKALRELVRIDT